MIGNNQEGIIGLLSMGFAYVINWFVLDLSWSWGGFFEEGFSAVMRIFLAGVTAAVATKVSIYMKNRHNREKGNGK